MPSNSLNHFASHFASHCASYGLNALRSIFLLVCLIGAVATFATPEEDLDNYVSQSADRLLAIISKHRDSYKENPEILISAVSEELRDITDLRRTSTAVMGKYARSATRDQRKRFAMVFSENLLNLYSSAMAEFDFETIEVTDVVVGGEPGKAKAIVTMKVTTASDAYEIRYQMRQYKSGEWKVLNVILQGTDFVSLFRSTFASKMLEYKGDIDQVIDHWSE